MTTTNKTKFYKLLAQASMLGAMAAVVPHALAADTPAPVKETERVASDSWITTKVKSEIMSSNLAQGFEVSVKTTHGVVMLSGKLGNADAVEKVKLLAEKVKGVKSVDGSGLSVAAK